ncbi:MAG: DEAD/DEAH box helicase, partial [Desulfosarcina sp.]
ALCDTDLLITSYGLLLRDIEQLRTIPFSLAVLDEIQQVKNADTKTHRAAARLDATVKIGLTGTPIENAVVELKALMDVVVPGYLGSDTEFSRRFASDTAPDAITAPNRGQLRRLIYPFTLRRLKSRVLEELPEKIEDIRFCELTDKQVKLYRDAIDSRAKGILSSLQNEQEAIPYIHIFALLTLLKQICNHPALVDKRPRAAKGDGQESGKWELFKELLDESLTSGQKVVVYSQFAEMIAIIADHLDRRHIGHVVLTGASRNRGRLIETFNSEPDCRVFVGSLKAGGTGIDLVAGSVVIHYDRWWNAAKEDQATDRVHRIGQRRGVQVFKLVTLGTLEEKISALIDKKRQLMENIVREDDPGLLKSFSRQELLHFLS